MSKIFPLLLNSIFFIAGVCSIAFERPFLCAASLLAISLLYIWKPGIKKMETVDDGTKASDGGAEAADDRDVRETDHQITELSLRVQELTESNRLLNEEIDHLKGEQETCLHPLYSCPLTSAFPINLEGFLRIISKSILMIPKAECIRSFTVPCQRQRRIFPPRRWGSSATM